LDFTGWAEWPGVADDGHGAGPVVEGGQDQRPTV